MHACIFLFLSFIILFPTYTQNFPFHSHRNKVVNVPWYIYIYIYIIRPPRPPSLLSALHQKNSLLYAKLVLLVFLPFLLLLIRFSTVDVVSSHPALSGLILTSFPFSTCTPHHFNQGTCPPTMHFFLPPLHPSLPLALLLLLRHCCRRFFLHHLLTSRQSRRGIQLRRSSSHGTRINHLQLLIRSGARISTQPPRLEQLHRRV